MTLRPLLLSSLLCDRKSQHATREGKGSWAAHLCDPFGKTLAVKLHALGFTEIMEALLDHYFFCIAVAAALQGAASGQLRAHGSPNMSPAHSGSLPGHISGAR